MKIGDKITICGKEFIAKAKTEAEDYCGNPDIEVELVAEDGDKRWLPEWLCDDQAAKDRKRGKSDGKRS